MTPSTTPEASEEIFNQPAFEDRLRVYLAANFPEISFDMHNRIHYGISQIAEDCSCPAPLAPSHQLIHKPDENERNKCGGCEAKECASVCIPWLNEHDAAIRKDERERVLEIINRGKSALYEIESDGYWNKVLQAKMDVFCWIEESLRSTPQQRGDER